MGWFLFDPLSLFFIVLILLISFPAFIYSLGYLKGHHTRFKNILTQLAMAAFVLSMILVVSVRQVFVFLIMWELMSLLSYFLILSDKDSPKSVEAGTIYLVMTHAGTAFLIMAFFLMYKVTGSFDFLVIKQALAGLPGHTKDMLFILLLIGFGTKAGIVPLHIWLPYAHPAAPSHISCLMSGVMIKTAIYGLLRFVFFMLGINALWWGGLVLGLAVVTCLVGVIYALIEQDIKTLLAYSSVENIGIILLGVGASMFLVKAGLPVLAVLALSAALYHLINHAVFKGLLFLGAGSIYRATGTRNIEKLGGLIKTMPWTALFFLIGAMAISALPPLNGFVSEWLTLVALFGGVLGLSSGFLKLFFCFCAAALALTGGLAAACFVKAFGIACLAKPRSQQAAAAKEVHWTMNFGAGFLALLTIALGLGAVWVFKLLAKIAGYTTGLDASAMNFSPGLFTLQPVGNISLSPVWLALLLLVIMGVVFILLNLVLGRSKVTTVPTWDCGYYKLTARNEYTATGFSKPFRLVLSFFLLPYQRSEKIKESFYHVKSFVYETNTKQVFNEYLYAPLVNFTFNLGRLAKNIQQGSVHIYLSYIFVALFLLLIFMGRF